MIGGMLADRPKAEFIGRERVLALLAFLATPMGVMALWLLMADPFLPFVILAALGASLLFARRLRSVGVGLLLGAAVWFGLLLWLSSALAVGGACPEGTTSSHGLVVRRRW